MTIYCATKNPGKLREFRDVGSQLAVPIAVEILPGLDRMEAPEETGDTFAANAALKAEFYSRNVEGLVFADDSGLAVDALGGAPGVYSARYSGVDGPDADNANNRRLLAEMELVTDRAARFVCVIAVARAGALLATFEGEVPGELLREERGSGGFGYDPLFYYPPFGKTLAEVSADEKIHVSHRGNALKKMFEYLSKL